MRVKHIFDLIGEIDFLEAKRIEVANPCLESRFHEPPEPFCLAKSMYFVLKHIMFPNLVNSEFMKSRVVIATWPHGKAMQKTSRKPCSTCWKSGWISSPGLRYTLQPGNGANPEVKANFYIGLGVHDIDDGLGFIENMALEFTTPTHSFAGYPSNSFQRIAQSKLARMFDQGGFQELHE